MPAEASFAHTRRNRCSGCWKPIFEHAAYQEERRVRLIFLLARSQGSMLYSQRYNDAHRHNNKVEAVACSTGTDFEDRTVPTAVPSKVE